MKKNQEKMEELLQYLPKATAELVFEQCWGENGKKPNKKHWGELIYNLSLNYPYKTFVMGGDKFHFKDPAEGLIIHRAIVRTNYYTAYIYKHETLPFLVWQSGGYAEIVVLDYNQVPEVLKYLAENAEYETIELGVSSYTNPQWYML